MNGNERSFALWIKRLIHSNFYARKRALYAIWTVSSITATGCSKACPEFVEWLQKEKKSFLFLTNSSERSPLELQQKLARMGLEIGVEHFYTSALATCEIYR